MIESKTLTMATTMTSRWRLIWSRCLVGLSVVSDAIKGLGGFSRGGQTHWVRRLMATTWQSKATRVKPRLPVAFLVISNSARVIWVATSSGKETQGWLSVMLHSRGTTAQGKHWQKQRISLQKGKNEINEKRLERDVDYEGFSTLYVDRDPQRLAKCHEHQLLKPSRAQATIEHPPCVARDCNFLKQFFKL